MTPRTNNITRKDLEAEMLKLRDTLDRWRVPVQAEIDKHRKALFGNGEPGLDELVRQNTARINKQDEMIGEIKKFIETSRPMITFYRVGVWFAGAIGASVIALIWGILTHTIELRFP